MKKILCFSLACIILLTTMFSINMSSVLATDTSKENMYNDIINSAKSNAESYDKVKFMRLHVVTLSLLTKLLYYKV